VSVYNAATGGSLVGSAQGQRPQTTITVSGLQPNTDYWASFDGSARSGPYRTLPLTTTTTTSSTTTTTTTTTTQPTTTTTTTSAPTTTTGGTSACTATYKVVGEWPGGFQGEVSVKAGASAVSSWTVGFSLGSGQTITQLWGGKFTASGSSVTVKNEAWNGALGSGAATTFGFIGSSSGSTSAPTATCTTP
jgi:hypothetical protein